MAEITPVSCTRKRSMSSSIQKPNWNRCLCHVKENVQGQLTAFTSKSWEKFESCSTRRRDEIWLIMNIILSNRGSGDSSGRDADCKATEWGLCT